jgi:hypothetical protein
LLIISRQIHVNSQLAKKKFQNDDSRYLYTFHQRAALAELENQLDETKQHHKHLLTALWHARNEQAPALDESMMMMSLIMFPTQPQTILTMASLMIRIIPTLMSITPV